MSREQQIRDALDRFVTRVREETDAGLQALARELLDAADRDATTGRVAVERAAVDVARAVARGGTQARHDLMSRVLAAVRRLDDAGTLSGILDALAQGAASEAVRTAVLIVDGGTARRDRHHGYDATSAPADVAIDVFPLLATVVATQRPAPVTADALTQSQVPPFMRASGGHSGLLLPVVVAHQVVALLYAEGVVRQPSDEGEPVWVDQVEVLVRHAAARLETVTSRRTVEVLSNPG